MAPALSRPLSALPETIRILIISLFLLSFLVLLPVSASGTDLTTSPTGLTISSVTGTSETRTFLILNSNTAANITNLQIVSLDLVRTDNERIIPASAITPASPATIVPPGGFVKEPVQFDFRSTASGEYTGSLLISANDSRTLMPVLVKLKDPFPLPLFVLIVFTFFSVVIYDYATRGLKSDQLKIKINSIESRLYSEFKQSAYEPFTGHFYEKIANPLISAKEKLRQANYEGAEAEYTKAETVWTRWISFRDQWRDRLQESEALKKRLDALIQEIRDTLQDDAPQQDLPIRVMMDRDLQKIWEDAANPETKPEATRTSIAELTGRVDLFDQTYRDISEAVSQLQTPLAPLPECIRRLRHDLLLLNYRANDPDTVAFLKEYPAKKQECLKNLVPVQMENDALILLQRISPGIYEYNLMNAGSEPAAIPGDQAAPAVAPDAAQRKWHIRVTKFSLWIYDKLHSIFIPAAILVFLGYSQLYLSNATFGVNGIGDYATLILWGFGTGPASDTIVQLVKSKGKAS